MARMEWLGILREERVKEKLKSRTTEPDDELWRTGKWNIRL